MCRKGEEDMSSYSEGQIHQLANALEAAEFTTADVTGLGQFNDLVGVRELVRGRRKFAEPPLLTPVRIFAPTSAKPTISRTSSQFKSWFDGVPEGERAAELTLRRLERSSLDGPIIAALGGEQAAKSSLADFYAALAEKETIGDFTPLTGYARDRKGVLRAVRGDRHGGGWCVRAFSVDIPDGWRGGSQVLSRN